MDRRTFIAGAFALLAAPLVGEAQPGGTVYRLGFLRRTSPEPAAVEAFRQGLRELGYVEGQNVTPFIGPGEIRAMRTLLPDLAGPPRGASRE